MPAAKKSTASTKSASKAKKDSSAPEDVVIAARPARRADLTGEGRTLDALGNEV